MTYSYNDGTSRKPHERWALRHSRLLTSWWCLFVQSSLECQQAQSVCCQRKISRGYCYQCSWGTWGITLEVDTDRLMEMRRGRGGGGGGVSILETWFCGLITVSQSAYIFAAVRPAPIACDPHEQFVGTRLYATNEPTMQQRDRSWRPGTVARQLTSYRLTNAFSPLVPIESKRASVSPLYSISLIMIFLSMLRFGRPRLLTDSFSHLTVPPSPQNPPRQVCYQSCINVHVTQIWICSTLKMPIKVRI